ncbi:MAG TPA: 4Fe-4S dicluster domain-containing protein [Kiritimatiellia bacterium]|nr:4Fe-4S dicluster domain-containing protein [Kiritimatiellia bacterium]HRU69603.1 4Fe-4S dicluster domain-containing protein [Kiritimatiellia bacterium]
MPRAILATLGARDRLLVDGVAVLAAHCNVSDSSVIRLDDLAEHALHPEDGVMAACFAGETSFVVAAARPRAVRALLTFGGVACDDLNIAWLALPFDREALKREYGVPWYPVIDRTRCSGCGTCHDYCLFSVYSREPRNATAERVRVTSPLNCKTGCPACSRLCPEAALIFPFCAEAELNGEIEAPQRRSPEALADALGDDPMRVLAERRAKRQLIDREKFVQAERDRMLYSGTL